MYSRNMIRGAMRTVQTIRSGPINRPNGFSALRTSLQCQLREYHRPTQAIQLQSALKMNPLSIARTIDNIPSQDRLFSATAASAVRLYSTNQRDPRYPPTSPFLNRTPVQYADAVYRSTALYAYEPQRPDELRLKPGDIITVVKQEGEWWEGEVNGQYGLFPYNYVTTPVALQIPQQDPSRRRTDRTIDNLTEGVKVHLQKVYATLAATVGISAAGSLLSMVTPLGMIHPIIPALGAFASVMGIMFTNTSHSPTLRTGLLGSFGFLSGMSIAPLLAAAHIVSPMLVPTALGLTAGLFASMTFVAMFAKQQSFLRWGPALFGGCIMLMVAGLGLMFVPVTSLFYPVLHNIYMYAGLGIFTVFIAYDTQMMIERYHAGEADVIQDAANMFINVKQIFVRLLSLLMMRDD